MPIKSSNTQGNPYHDEGTGQFTSGDKINSKQIDSFLEDLIHKSELDSIDSFLDSFDQNNIDSFLDSFDNNIPEYKECKTAEEAEKLGNQIFGGKSVCHYNPDNRFYANRLNEALFGINKIFPKIIQDNLVFFSNNWESILDDKTRTLSEVPNIAKRICYRKFKDKDMAVLFCDLIEKRIKKSLNILYKYNTWNNEAHLIGGTTQFESKTIYFNGVISPVILENVFAHNNCEIHGIDKSGFLWLGYHELGHIISGALLEKIESSELAHITNIFNNKKHMDTTAYGKVSQGEFISEAVSDCMINGENATESNKKVFNYLKDMYAKYYESSK